MPFVFSATVIIARGPLRIYLSAAAFPVLSFTMKHASFRRVRTGLVAVAVGVCAGAIAGQSIFDTAVSNRSATRPTNQADLPISEQPEPVKSPVEPIHVTSPDNPVANEAQISTLGQSTSNQPPCDVSLCER